MKYFIMLLILLSNSQAKKYQNITFENLIYNNINDYINALSKPKILNTLTFVGKFLIDIFIKNMNISSDKEKVNKFIEIIKSYTKKNNLNNDTINLLTFTFFKAFSDSSKNKNDIQTYRQCSQEIGLFQNENYINIMNFYIVRINKKNNERKNFKKIKKELYENNCQKIDTNSEICKNLKKNITVCFPSFKYDSYSFSFGLCLPKFKKEIDIKNELEVYYKFLIFEILKICNNLFQLNDKDDINIIEMSNLYENKIITKFASVDYFNLIPFYIIVIIIIIMIFGILPTFLFRSFFIKVENQEKNLNDISINHPNFDKKKFLSFQKKLFLKSNWQELMFYKNPTSDKINNDSGLLYIKGLRGLSMILLCFGFLLLNLFTSPVSIYNELDFSSLLKNFFYFLFFSGIRYAPRILLSCSGYILFFKLINYLDEKNDEELEKKINEYNKVQESSDLKTKMEIDLEMNEEIINNNYIVENENENEDNKNKKIHEDILKRKRNIEDVKLYSLIQFILYQVHKYIFFILILSFCLFSLPIMYKIESLFYYDLNGIIFLGSMWKIFIHDYINPIKNEILNLILGYTSTYSFHYSGNESENLLYFFWLFYNEVIFFLISSIIIYFGYKYKLGIDLYFKMIIILTLMIKIILFFFIEDFQNGSLYYYYNNFGSIFVNPLYNYSYYVIGIYFGSLNYVLQKRITYSDIEHQEKPFLLSFLPVLSFYQQNGIITKIINLFICIILILFNLLYYIYSKIIKTNSNNDDNIYSDSFEEVIFGKINNFFLLIDTEIYVFLIHLSCFLFCIGNNSVIKFLLTNSFWSIFNKIYTIFIIIINPTILYILFTIDMRIPLNISYCLLYTLISGFLTFIISILCYIFFELPCKRIIKLILKEQKKR